MTALIAPASGSCTPVIQPLFNAASFLSSDGKMYGKKKQEVCIQMNFLVTIQKMEEGRSKEAQNGVRRSALGSFLEDLIKLFKGSTIAVQVSTVHHFQCVTKSGHRL